MRGNPDIAGLAARAWKCVRKRDADDPPDWDGRLSQWQIHGAGFHPLWSWWLVQTIHLRDLPGVRPAVKRYPEAEHELMIIALNPEMPMLDPDEKPGRDKFYSFLTPIDVVHQFHGVGDEGAVKICEGAVRLICNGEMSPDQDYRRVWRQLINNTVEHMVLGSHPQQRV